MFRLVSCNPLSNLFSPAKAGGFTLAIIKVSTTWASGQGVNYIGNTKGPYGITDPMDPTNAGEMAFGTTGAHFVRGVFPGPQDKDIDGRLL